MLYHMKLSGYYVGVFMDQYWDRIILLSGIIGFFVREMYKLQLKKEEIKFSMILDKTINSINDYLYAYNSFKKQMCDISFEVFEGTITGRELDQITNSYLDKLKQQDISLRLLLSKDSYINYHKITEECIILKDSLSNILSYKSLNNDKASIALLKNNAYFKSQLKHISIMEELVDTAIKATQDEMGLK